MRPPHDSRHRSPYLRPTLCAAIVVICGAAIAPAADLPPEVISAFTRRVQPLVINRCAAGACHGGADSPAPRFRRAAGGGQPDRLHTLANLQALLEAVGPERDPRTLAALLAAGHPRSHGTSRRRASPLTTPERVSLDRWLADVRAAETAAAAAKSGVVPVSAEIEATVASPPNRFRAMLDASANPPALPPPEAPRGLIFKNDEPPPAE